jgi:hypothetical protein
LNKKEKQALIVAMQNLAEALNKGEETKTTSKKKSTSKKKGKDWIETKPLNKKNKAIRKEAYKKARKAGKSYEEANRIGLMAIAK